MPYINPRKLYIGRVSTSTSNSFWTALAKCKPLFTDVSNVHRGFAFACFATPAQAAECLIHLKHSLQIQACNITVAYAKERYLASSSSTLQPMQTSVVEPIHIQQVPLVGEVMENLQDSKHVKDVSSSSSL